MEQRVIQPLPKSYGGGFSMQKKYILKIDLILYP